MFSPKTFAVNSPIRIIRDKLIRTLAEKLQAREEELYQRIDTLKGRRPSQAELSTEKNETDGSFTSLLEKAQLGLIKIFIDGGQAERQLIRDTVSIEQFTDPFLKQFAEILFPIYKEGTERSSPESVLPRVEWNRVWRRLRHASQRHHHGAGTGLARL